MTLRSVARQLFDLGESGVTPVLVSPEEFRFRAEFFAALGSEFAAECPGSSLQIDVLSRRAGTQSSGLRRSGFQRTGIFDAIFHRLDRRLAGRVNRIDGTSVVAEVTSTISRPSRSTRTVVVGYCQAKDASTLPDWTQVVEVKPVV